MGTYLNIQLKNTTEENILDINADLELIGYPTERFNGIPYGAFVTRERLEEDAHYMNTDPEGLEQCPHFERPITPKLLESFIWNRIGFHQTKLSCMETEEVKRVTILRDWIENNLDKIDKDKSDGYERHIIDEYLEYAE